MRLDSSLRIRDKVFQEWRSLQSHKDYSVLDRKLNVEDGAYLVVIGILHLDQKAWETSQQVSSRL